MNKTTKTHRRGRVSRPIRFCVIHRAGKPRPYGNGRNGYRQIFFENLPPNLRFGVEIVSLTTISTNYNHYDHVIRNEKDYKECPEYIDNNLIKWIIKNKTQEG